MTPPPKQVRRTRQEMKAETRKRLLEAAADVFIQRGFQGATVEEITAEAGFSRGAFYSNFESKEEMFVELLQERVYESYRDMLQRVPMDQPPLERIRWAGRTLMERYQNEDERWLFELWLECLAHAARYRDFASLAATFWSGNRAALAAQIGDMMATLDDPPAADPKDVATAVIALDIGLKLQNLVDPQDAPLELYPRLYELLFGPLVSPSKDEGG